MIKADLLDISSLRDMLRDLKDAVVLDPYPEVVPTVLEDKLLYLTSSIYGGISPLPLFSFRKEGARYVLSPKLHEMLAELVPSLKVLYIDIAGEPQYPFTAVSVVLRDLGVSINGRFLKEYVCPELRSLEQDDIPLARSIKSVISRFAPVPSGSSARSLRCLCGLCEEKSLDLDSLALAIFKEGKHAERRSRRFNLAELDEEDRAIVVRVIRGLSIPEFRRELIDLLNRYEV